jgi:hypothetical protein
MRFDEWRYLYPPRPDENRAIPPSMLSSLEGDGWIAQAKMNGTCNVLAVSPDRKTIKAMSRHADAHKLWSPSEQTLKAFANLPGNGWYVFVAELLHSKVTGGTKDTNYINDILVADGEYLVGSRFVDRRLMLTDIFGDPDGPITHHVVDERTWVARSVNSGFAEFYSKMDNAELEGVVLKKATGKLALCAKEKSNVMWLLKCRKRGKNFSF